MMKGPILFMLLGTIIVLSVVLTARESRQIEARLDRVEQIRSFCDTQIQPDYCFEVALQDGFSTVLAVKP